MSSATPRVAAPASARRLFALYAVVSLVPVLVLGTVLLTLVQRQADRRGLAEGVSEAGLLGRTAVAPLLDGHDLRQRLRADERTALARSVGQAVAAHQVMRLRLRDLDGHVVFSDDNSGDPPDDESLAAAHGKTVDELTRLDQDAVNDGLATDAGPRVVEVYEPLATASGHRLGVLELYLPYAPIAADIARGQQLLIVSLIVGLAVLWLCLLVVSMSVTGRLRRQAASLAYLASHDALTSLPNRGEFAAAVAAAALDASDELATAVAVIDVDRFKDVNDTLGHRNGDQLLAVLAERLRSRLRGGDTVARLGGDEFGVVLTGVHGASEAIEVLSRLRAAFSEPLEIDGVPLALEASVGFALAPADGDDVDTLLQRADVAMYVAKQQHLGVAHYRPEHEQHSASTLALIAELGSAIEHDELLLHYQPKTELLTESVTAVEALLRWQHPVRGLLYPDAFLPAAEQTELMDPLTRWVLRRAATDLQRLDDTGLLAVAVNVSARSIMREDFASDVLRLLGTTGLPPRRLILEITETAILTDPSRAAITLNRLHAAGVRISIDDFGAGQTSLGYLATLPISELKIDKAFVLSMIDDDRNAAIVRSVIELGHSLGFSVTAEGVETEAALSSLFAAHCDTVQGYLLSRPTTAEAVPAAISTAQHRVRAVSGAF
jgi:diguanylate cyclase (GGDEF)-like protein